jgi:hypothetical protein
MPTGDIERAVYAALILAGEPVNNRRLAELTAHQAKPQGELRSSKASFAQPRKGREVLISLH